MLIVEPLILSKRKNILRDHLGNKHQLVLSNTMRLAVWKISGKLSQCKKFQGQLPTLLLGFAESQQRQVMKRPGESVSAGVAGSKLIHFDVI